ncbi:MAG: hypothetical protein QM765_03850 [Myxococcales bacterium]
MALAVLLALTMAAAPDAGVAEPVFPGSDSDPALKAELDRALALRRQAKPDEALALLESIRTRALAVNRPEFATRALHRRGEVLNAFGRVADSEAAFRTAYSEAEKRDDAWAMGRAAHELGSLLQDPAGAEWRLKAVVAQRKAKDYEGLQRTSWGMADRFLSDKRPLDATAPLADYVEASEALGDHAAAVKASFRLSEILLEHGERTATPSTIERGCRYLGKSVAAKTSRACASERAVRLCGPYIPREVHSHAARAAPKRSRVDHEHADAPRQRLSSIRIPPGRSQNRKGLRGRSSRRRRRRSRGRKAASRVPRLPSGCSGRARCHQATGRTVRRRRRSRALRRVWPGEEAMTPRRPPLVAAIAVLSCASPAQAFNVYLEGPRGERCLEWSRSLEAADFARTEGLALTDAERRAWASDRANRAAQLCKDLVVFRSCGHGKKCGPLSPEDLSLPAGFVEGMGITEKDLAAWRTAEAAGAQFVYPRSAVREKLMHRADSKCSAEPDGIGSEGDWVWCRPNYSDGPLVTYKRRFLRGGVIATALVGCLGLTGLLVLGWNTGRRDRAKNKNK